MDTNGAIKRNGAACRFVHSKVKHLELRMHLLIHRLWRSGYAAIVLRYMGSPCSFNPPSVSYCPGVVISADGVAGIDSAGGYDWTKQCLTSVIARPALDHRCSGGFAEWLHVKGMGCTGQLLQEGENCASVCRTPSADSDSIKVKNK